MRKYRLLSCLLALACSISIGVPVSALQESPVLSKESSNSTNAKIYDYQPLVYHVASKANFGNTIFASAQERVYDDSGNLYRVTDSSPLMDSSQFSHSSIRTTTNPQAVKKIAFAESGQEDAGCTSFVIQLADDYLYRDVVIVFTTTFTAKEDTILPVAATAGAKQSDELEVKKGAKITCTYKLNIDDDALYITNYSDKQVESAPNWYGDVIYQKDVSFPMGVEGLILDPERDGDADIEWMNSGNLVAQVNFGPGNLSYIPKLSTEWSATSIVRKRMFGDAYVRFFRTNPTTDNGTVTLYLTNPFLTLEGEETIDHEDVIIYEQIDGKLKEVTHQFQYTTDTDGNGAFMIQTDHLGNYILSSLEL